MKITKIEAIPIEIPFKKPHELRYGTMHVCDHVITRVYTDDDIVGIGEVSNIHIITEETQGGAEYAIRKILGPALEGQDVFNFAMINRKMDAALHGNPMAKASIDMACYDIVGKKLGLPVYTLLGGAYREKIELTMSIGVQSADQMAKEAISLAEQGFGIKLKFGLDPSAREDVERARIVREAVGPKAKIWGDANGGYTSVARCIQALKEMEKYNLYLLEQPAARYDYDTMIELRRQVSTPIGADESVFSPEDAWNVVKNKIADAINVKITEAGGFFKSRRVVDISEGAKIPLLVGSMGDTGVSTAAGGHLAASIEMLEFPCDTRFHLKLVEDILEEPLVIKEGFLYPQGPGLGIKLDEKKLKKYRID